MMCVFWRLQVIKQLPVRYAWVMLTYLRGISIFYIAVETGVLHEQMCIDTVKADKSPGDVVRINSRSGLKSKTLI